jgi:hypothetical protein
MKRSQTRIFLNSDQSRRTRAHVFLDLFRSASSQTLTRAGAAAAVAWVPVAILSAIRGGSSFRSFLTDYASLSRFLIVIPVLILASPPLRDRLALVVQHFEMFLIPEEQQTRIRQDWQSCQRLQNSKLAQVILVLLAYATAAWLGQYLSPGGAEFMEWWKGAGGFRFFSFAGTWAVFISYPILMFLAFLWLWRQLLWIRWLRSTTRLNLCLIAAHPDNLGGLGFIEASLRGQLPLSFCMGVGLAGAIADRILHDGQKLVAFRHLPLILVAAVLIVCVSPYFLFTSTLVQIRRRGMLRYGAFARAVGEQFEKKWLHRADSLDEDVLSVSDFSTTTDLYGVVANINNIRVVPVGAVDLYALVGVALIPGIPVVIAAIPFDTVIRDAMKLLF